MNYLFMTHPLRTIMENLWTSRKNKSMYIINSPVNNPINNTQSVEQIKKTDARIIFEKSSTKNPKQLTVDVNMSDKDVDYYFNHAVFLAKKDIENKRWDYYKIYLKHIYKDRQVNVVNIMNKLDRLREMVECRISDTDSTEEFFVRNLLYRNEYVSKTTKRPGVTVKLFHTYRDYRDVMVKVYIFDPNCPSLKSSIEANFENEATFQLYANQLYKKLDFISPELYSWGQIRKIAFDDNGYHYKCLFLIMEYIEGLTLREATYSTQNMEYIYDKVIKINKSLSGELLHHNDLHGGNIIVRQTEKSPLPEVIVLDFGEASLGPRKPLFHNKIY